MKTILIILTIAAVVAIGVFIATKFFKTFRDDDNDGIPDVVEEKVAEVKNDVKKTVNTVKTRVKRVKEELGDVSDALREVASQSKDVVSAVKGGARKGRKPATNKSVTKKPTTPKKK